MNESQAETPQKETPRKKSSQQLLDEAIEQTFPASDPIAVGSSISEREEPPADEDSDEAAEAPERHGKDHGGGVA